MNCVIHRFLTNFRVKLFVISSIFRPKMYLNSCVKHIPFRTLTFLFIIWSYSSYAQVGKNVGFYCDDESIKHPYHGDSVRLLYLLVVLYGIYSLVIYISEYLFYEVSDGNAKSRFRLLLNYYCSGAHYVIAICEVLKLMFTELRPHFFTTCMPDMSNIECSSGLITQFNCTGEGPSWLIKSDIYKSFPSGHAAASAYAYIYINIYLCANKRNISDRYLSLWWCRIVASISLIFTIFCCISRIVDRRHFWWDVFGGAFVGVIFGIIVVNLSLMRASQMKSSKSAIVSNLVAKEK